MEESNGVKPNIAVAVREPYVKPIIEVVELMPKETVLGGCLSASNGSVASGCNILLNGCAF